MEPSELVVAQLGGAEFLQEAIEKAAQQSDQRLWDDSEWTEPRVIHLKDIIRAFAVGVIDADAWFTGYSIPPNFEAVMSALCGAVVSKYGKQGECTEVSLLDLEAFYREFIDATPLAREWNDWPGSGFTSAFDSTPKERTFINLDALVRNATIHIRDDRRAFDKFNADFEVRHGKESLK